MFFTEREREKKNKDKEFIRTGHEFELQICKAVWYINVWIKTQNKKNSVVKSFNVFGNSKKVYL